MVVVVVRARDQISQASSELSANERSAAGRQSRRNAVLRAVRTPILMMLLSKRIRSSTTGGRGGGGAGGSGIIIKPKTRPHMALQACTFWGKEFALKGTALKSAAAPTTLEGLCEFRPSSRAASV
jgi:hypothetical protein